ncbi:DNA primase [Actinomyces bovis]|uniref:DNA primase n=1 Tax=Actinomyces bovis TaxID=1658 RepID=A0ABY1VPU4_9ACTO|nr:DNA primase [Actinomyces bovis]SPT54146.1 DNA primase [Actinomyces bovis]VEG53603.1 DNA primase [Actinomyces israelii]
MAGRIKREDIEAVRERARIEDVVGEHVTLKSAGVGSLKGLCPFHDERTPSFNVRPQLGLWHCFGCGEGGDVIDFVQRVHHLSFSEAVEQLAGRTGVQLRYEEGGQVTRGIEPGTRQRLLDANRLAEAWYHDQLATPAGQAGREFLTSRGFTQAHAARYRLGYAPAGWDNLCNYLRSKGYTEAELMESGLATTGRNSNRLYDRFRDRLIWPIRDITGATVGFGARRMSTEDPGPKYLNTPETAIYHKAQVLYGLDLAKNAIAEQHRVVVVEGYTDVMAAHASGVTTAVATCGTAFGEGHTRIVRRLLGDSADPAAGVILTGYRARGGEVIFTFDGDAAGQKAAMRAFAEDQHFATQTFVAVAESGMDPCDLRLNHGEEAIPALIDSRKPLFEFVIRTSLKNLDLSTPEGRVRGLHAAAPVVAGIRDFALRREYTRALAGWLGMPERDVVSEVRYAQQHAGRQGARPGSQAGAGAQAGARPGGEEAPMAPRGSVLPDLSDPVVRMEHDVLAVMLQMPGQAEAAGADDLDAQGFTQPVHRAVFEAILAAGGASQVRVLTAQAEQAGVPKERLAMTVTNHWLKTIRAGAIGEVDQALTELAVVALPIPARPSKTNPALLEADRGAEEAYARGVIRSFQRVSVTRALAALRSEQRRIEPSSERNREIFERIVALEAQRAALSERD